MSSPLKVSLLDEMNDFIKINKLKEVTNPIYLQKNVPTSDGLLSYEIFGVSTSDRNSNMAYIDLKGHYMLPLAAVKLKSYDRTLSSILMSKEKYILTKDGNLLQSDEGQTGPEFLYNIWGKVKIKEKTTILTKEVEDFFEQSRDELFVDKVLVLPAFYRDINDLGESNKSTSEINSKYSAIISYTQNMHSYSETFSMMKYITQSRVQGLLIELYEDFMLKKVKGQPSKYGMLRRFVMSKNIDYGARLVISAPILKTGDPDSMPIKVGVAGVPLATVCSCFYPFILQKLKAYFESEFIKGGKYPVWIKNGKESELKYVTINDTFQDEYLEKMIERFIDSPSTRFDTIPIPSNIENVVGNLALVGRFDKGKTTLNRPATVTDILYLIALDVVEDKHVYITRFPLDNYNGQFPVKIHITTTLKTAPVFIGDRMYQYYPIIDDKTLPENGFIDTLIISNTYLERMGGDYDGDMVNIKPVFSIEGNRDCVMKILSKSYYLDAAGKPMKDMTKDFILTAYKLTKKPENYTQRKDPNIKKPKYALA